MHEDIQVGSKQCVHVMVLGVCGSNSIHTD